VKQTEARVMKKESSRAGATLMKTKSSGVRAMFMKRRAQEPELCHFYNSSEASEKTYLLVSCCQPVVCCHHHSGWLSYQYYCPPDLYLTAEN